MAERAEDNLTGGFDSTIHLVVCSEATIPLLSMLSIDTNHPVLLCMCIHLPIHISNKTNYGNLSTS